MGLLYDILLPPIVMRTWWVSDLLGLMATTIHPDMTLLPAGTADLCMKKIVLVPLTRFPKTSASLPMLLENAVTHVPLPGPHMSYVYA